jgi:hypothetical protein
MTIRFRVVALFVMLLGSGAIAAGTDSSAPRTPQDVIGVLKAGNDRFAQRVQSGVTERQSPARARRRAASDGPRPLVRRFSSPTGVCVQHRAWGFICRPHGWRVIDAARTRRSEVH